MNHKEMIELHILTGNEFNVKMYNVIMWNSYYNTFWFTKEGNFMKKIFKVSLITLSVLAVALTCCIFTALAVSNDGGAMPVADRVSGDVDGDGSLTVKDVILLRRAIANHDYDSTDPLKVDGGDYNGDGVVDLFDLNAMRSFFSNQDFYDDAVAEQGLLDLKHTLRVNEDGSFKVLILSDVQCYNETRLKNSGTLDVIEAMVEAEDPDLVLFLGDNTWSRNSAADLRSYLKVMVKPIEDRKIPWAHVYGNHDAEDNDPWYWAIDKEEQQAVYEEFEYCISKSGPESVPGVGNYVLPVLEHDSDKIAFNIWALDSMMYRTDVLADIVENNGTSLKNSFYGKYEGMSEAHVTWYKETSELLEKYNGGETIPAMMYFHIPLQETYYAWADAMSGGANGAANLVGQKGENISAPVINADLFDAIVERGDVKVVANGHDHENDFAVDYKGVTLAYCGSTGTEAYHDYDIVGGRVVDFGADGSVSTHMSYVNDITEYSNDKPIIEMDITKDAVTNAADDRFDLVSKDYASNPKAISWSEEVGRYVVNFTGGTTTPSVFNYSASNLTPVLYDGFSYEIAFKVDSVNFGTDYVGILDFEESGGFGLNVYKNGSSTDTYVLKVEISAGHTSGWNAQDVILEVGEWYHVVFSYNYIDYRTRSTAVYVDGIKVAGADKLGESQLYRAPSFSSRAGEEYICIGGCAQAWQKSGVKSDGMNGFTGSIALCNLLPYSTDANTAFNLSNAFWGDNKKAPPVLDLEISADSVVNAAENRPALNSASQTAGTKSIVYDEALGKYVVSFVGDNNKPATYTLAAGDLESMFADGFSYEVMVKVTDISKIGDYHGILDFEEAGGFGLNIHKGTDGKFRLETEIAVTENESRKWYANSSGNLELDTWYHCVFVYDGKSTAFYINGVKVAGTDNVTAPYCPTGFGGVAPYICIGGCAAAAAPSTGIKGMTGAIADANIFVDPITAEEALALYNAAIAK